MGFSARNSTTFIASPLAGVFTDRWNRHRTLLVTQSLAMAHGPVLMTALAVTGVITVWQIVAMAVVAGVDQRF